MNLSNLKPEEGSIHNPKKRLGRGQGSGKGGTAARGPVSYTHLTLPTILLV